MLRGQISSADGCTISAIHQMQIEFRIEQVLNIGFIP